MLPVQPIQLIDSKALSTAVRLGMGLCDQPPV
jgi:hypothetical protein